MRELKIILLILLLLPVNSFSCEYYGNMKDQGNLLELQNTEYCIMYDTSLRSPIYASQHLIGKKLKHIDRSNNFRPDRRLNKNERTELKDYIKTGFDRGHLAPAGDMTSEISMKESFLLSNIIPQTKINNRFIHKKIEMAVRKMAIERGELYVVTGVIFDREIKVNNLNVPTKIYKAIVDPKEKLGCAYISNNDDSNTYEVVTIDTINKVSKLDIFPKLKNKSECIKMESIK